MSRLHRKTLRRRDGFTLVELLVVIAILALLLSLLMPSLSRAKELARRVVCASNVRTLTQACLNYAGENSERLPYLHIGTTSSTVNPSPYWLLRKQVNPQPTDTEAEQNASFSRKYNLVRDQFYCPSNGPDWNKDTFWKWADDNVSSVVGYPYFGGNRWISVQGALKVSYNPTPPSYPVFPVFSSQASAYGVLWVDITRRQPDNSWFGPDRRGVNHFADMEPVGQNVGMIDNSVRWQDWPNYTNALNNGGWMVYF